GSPLHVHAHTSGSPVRPNRFPETGRACLPESPPVPETSLLYPGHPLALAQSKSWTSVSQELRPMALQPCQSLGPSAYTEKSLPWIVAPKRSKQQGWISE